MKRKSVLIDYISFKQVKIYERSWADVDRWQVIHMTNCINALELNYGLGVGCNALSENYCLQLTKI